MYLKGLYEFHDFNYCLININIQRYRVLDNNFFIVSCNFIITMNLIFFQDEELISHQLCFLFKGAIFGF